MDTWERLDETPLPDKEAFYTNLNMKNIKDFDYIRDQKVFKDFNLKNPGEYNDLYVQ